MSLRLLTAAAAGNAMGKTTQGVDAQPLDLRALRPGLDGRHTNMATTEALFTALQKEAPGTVFLCESLVERRLLHPDLSAEQFITQVLEQRSPLVPDPDGDVRLSHGGRIVVMSADGLRASPEELEAAIKAGRLLVDERHVVESPELAPSAEVMKSLERIARPLAEPAFPWRALELAGDGDRPNRKQRRKAPKAARREQRRRR
jgi:hypothetical protein